VNQLVRQGKVRDVYDIGEHLLMVASDRISAFDHILPTRIPDKGRILTQISKFWFDRIDVPHHLVSTDVRAVKNLPEGLAAGELDGRSMIVKKCEVVPIECVVRGYLVGSGLKDYQRSGSVCGIDLPEGLVNGSKFPEPIFTPATKADEGHDENQLILIDEVLTPDSSRFWPAAEYQPGQNQPSFDKQFVRNWLESTDWDKESTPPELPTDIVTKTREKYIDAYERLTEQTFAWK
jgi:phosphoribosylaminoimidazole-succinocarboxamide synthase